MKSIQDDPQHPARAEPQATPTSPTDFLQQQINRQPLQQRIERQLSSRDRRNLPPEELTPAERLAAQFGSSTPAGSKPIEEMTPQERLAAQFGSSTPASAASKPIEEMTPQERLAAQFGSTTPAATAGKTLEQMTPAERLALQLGMQLQHPSPGSDDVIPTYSHVVECDGGMEL